MGADNWPRETKWRHLYARSVKVKRSEQLGFEYPRLSDQEHIETEKLNVLFICSMNQWRSPTAEEVYKKHPLLNCRSAGTSKKARKKVGVSEILWADLIILMEDKHYDRLDADFRNELQHKETHVLEIEDNYRYMDEELIEELQYSLDPILLVCRKLGL